MLTAETDSVAPDPAASLWYTVQFNDVDGGNATVAVGADVVRVARCVVELPGVLHPAAITAVSSNPTRASE